MPSFERGVYEPPSDDIHVFDENEDMDEEGSRLPLLIVIALLVLAAFAGVVWLAYSQGVQRGRSDAPRLIVAASGPTKEAAPDSNAPGTHSALKIYQQQAPADEDADSVPPPPTKTIKPATPPDVTAKQQFSPMAATPKPVTTAPAEKIVTAAAKPAATVVSPPPAALKPTVSAEKPDRKSVASSSVSIEAPSPVATAAPTPLSAAPPVAAPKPAAASPSGAYVLQIGAYKSQADAEAAWNPMLRNIRLPADIPKMSAKPISGTRASGIACASDRSAIRLWQACLLYTSD